MQVTRAGVDRSTNYSDEEITSIEVAKTAWDGEVGQGSVPIPDPAGNQEPYEGEQLLLEQSSQTILDGFVGPTRTERGSSVVGTRRVHTHTLADDNALLQGHATPGWSRPAEAPAARWAAFVDDFLPGSIDTTWLLTTNESGVTLPKNTYRTDSLFDDLLADTVRPTGKTVYIEARRFHWHLPTEGQTCAIVIHDTNAISSTSFQPLTSSRSKDGMDLRNKIYARNDAAVVVSVSDATSITRHDSGGMKHEGYSEYGTETAAEMSRDIAVTLAERKDERVTWTYDIGPMTAAQAVELIPGSQMTVTTAVHGLSGATKRIASVTLRYRHGRDSRHFVATVELGFPKRFRRKPTKTSSSADSTGGSGVGGKDDCGCCCPDPWDPGGCQGDCSENFSRASITGLGTSELAGFPDWVSSGTATTDGEKALLGYGNAPYLPLLLSTTTEILVKQLITRGTTANSSMSVNPLAPAATDHDVAARLTVLPSVITQLGVKFADLGLIMDHADHGGRAQGDLILELAFADGTASANVTDFVDSGLGSTFTVWTRFRIEPAGSTGSTIMAKAWLDGASEPAWMLTHAADWPDGGGLPIPIQPNLLVLDNRVGADETIWAVDSICFITGFACSPPDDAPVTDEDHGLGDGSTTSYATTFAYKVGSVTGKIDHIEQTVTATDGANVVFGRAPETDEQVTISYVKTS